MQWRGGYWPAVALSALPIVAALVAANPVPAAAGYGSTPALQLPWPMGTGWNVSGFSYSNTPGCTSNGTYYPNDHLGSQAYALDFGLTNGSEVDAAAYGQVKAVASDPTGGGNYVWINHPNNIQTYYGHLSTTIYVSVDQWVTKGQRIALSDTSGYAIGAHLHFNVTTGGTSPFNGTAYKPEPMSGTGPPGYMNWDQYGCAGDSTTTFTSTPPNEQVALADKFDRTQTLLLRSTDAAVWYSPTDSNGTPLGWRTLGGLASGTPCAAWIGNRIDVYVVGSDSYPFRITSLDGGTSWGTWVRQAGAVSSGYAETENINCTRRPDGNIDLYMRGLNGQAIHMSTDASGDIVAVHDLGGVVKGAPSGAWNATQTRLDIYAIGTNDQPYHGYWDTLWRGWTDVYYGLSGQAEAEMINAIRLPDGTIDVFLRGGGQNNGVPYRGYTDSLGNIIGWEPLGAPGSIIRGASEGKEIRVIGPPDSTREDVFAIGNTDQAYQITWLNGVWGQQWRPLAGQVAA